MLMTRAFDGFGTSCMKFSGDRPWGAQMPRPRVREPEKIPRGCLGGWAQVELADALLGPMRLPLLKVK